VSRAHNFTGACTGKLGYERRISKPKQQGETGSRSEKRRREARNEMKENKKKNRISK
jgi:hypothetical protein